MSETNSSESDLNLLLCDDMKMDTGNLCDDPLYKAIDALYNRGWTDYHRKNKHDPRGTREWQTILDMFRLQKKQLNNRGIIRKILDT